MVPVSYFQFESSLHDLVDLRFFVGYGLELSRIVSLIIYHLKRRYLCKTEAELKEAWAPVDLGYGRRIPEDMLVVTIVLCYSVIAPVIIPFGVIYFGLGWLVLRNQWEEHHSAILPLSCRPGLMIQRIKTTICANALALILEECKILNSTYANYRLVVELHPTTKGDDGSIIVQGIPYHYGRADPTVIRPSKFTFHPLHPYVARNSTDFSNPRLLRLLVLKETPNMELIFRSFIPPSLSANKSDDDHFEDALYHVSRSGSFA
ncbi:hypothetical protein RJ639_015140 [Escallonia herrerae]|uniref:CSC1/OSCA1-like 7TM region domain-containing protein n=1 Tax=Escallonia herrerae TaxID=1293975 RepID=A0AA89ANR7_9ASTE|nr:hypothetical protein RJ639_015140 [Escallonia herrerae]